MSVTVTTPAPSYDLVTLDMVRQVMGATPSDDDLTKLITRASSTIAQLAGRTLAKEAVTEILPGSGRVQLVLERVPVISVSEVRQGDTVMPGITINDRFAGLIMYATGFVRREIRTRSFINDYSTGEYLPEWEVDYVAGYWLPSFPGTPGTNDVRLPGDLEQACLDTIQAWYNARGRSSDVTSERIGDWSASYGTSQVPEGGRDIAINYRRTLL